MIVDIITSVRLNFSISEFNSLVEEMNLFIKTESTFFTGSIEGILEELESNMVIASKFTIISQLFFSEIEDFFSEFQIDIEEINNDRYPLLSDLLITIGNKN